MKLETKHATAQVKSADESTGEATFVVSVFNTVDEGGDVVLKGAFTDTLKLRTPKLVADHVWQVTHKLGKVVAGRETDEGLEVDVKFNMEKQLAREVFSDLKFDPDGAEFSFGYEVAEGGVEFKDGIRLLKKLDLYEVGPVLIGMHPATRLVGAKSDTMTDGDGNVWKLVTNTSNATTSNYTVTAAPPTIEETFVADTDKATDDDIKVIDQLAERVGNIETALTEVLRRA